MSPGLGESLVVFVALVLVLSAFVRRSPWGRQLWNDIVKSVRGWDAKKCQRCGRDLGEVSGPRCPDCGALKGYRVPPGDES